ncbi:MAG: 30S ribosomal protein S3 [Actinomycetia bacterium]|nr:30S ribosomal protein S3 [Actinomycetes bacterium]
MGQKVHPLGLRLGIIEDWRSRWFATKDFPKFLEEDLKIRSWIDKKLSKGAISKVEIERAGDRVKLDLHTARPGVVIGKRGAEVDLLRADLEKLTGKHIQVNILEVARPELDATLVAQNVAEQLSARVAFRRAMKKAVNTSMKSGAQGIKINCAGRLGGSEMARREWYREGRVPLHTLRAKVDYGFVEAKTTFGRIGVKVWIYQGEVFGSRFEREEEARNKLGLADRKRPSRGMVKPGKAPGKTEKVEAKTEQSEAKIITKAGETIEIKKQETKEKATGKAATKKKTAKKSETKAVKGAPVKAKETKAKAPAAKPKKADAAAKAAPKAKPKKVEASKPKAKPKAKPKPKAKKEKE